MQNIQDIQNVTSNTTYNSFSALADTKYISD